jgi:hypothetical protein
MAHNIRPGPVLPACLLSHVVASLSGVTTPRYETIRMRLRQIVLNWSVLLPDKTTPFFTLFTLYHLYYWEIELRESLERKGDVGFNYN